MQFRISRVEVVAAGISALAAPVAIVLAFGFESAAFAVSEKWEHAPGWFVIALNTIPSFVAGALWHGGAALALKGWRSHAETTRWLPRNAVPLVLAVGLAALIIVDWSYPDFFMVAGFLVFPLCALVGGITADTVIASKRGSNVSH